MTRVEEIDRAWGGYKVRSTHRYDEKSFKEGAEWADKTMIEKACKWLSLNIDEYITEGSREGISLENQKQLIIDFRKAMEE